MPYNDIEQAAVKEIEALDSLQALEELRVKYLGRKGIITDLLSNISALPTEDRPKAGAELNSLKKRLSDLLDSQKVSLSSKPSSQVTSTIDLTLPGIAQNIGKKHPLIQTMDEICEVFVSLGFRVFEGPEIETEYNNFQALNIPLNHPSADAFDTFYLDTSASNKKDQKKLLLRSHTSPGQVRVMSKYKPPVAVIVPGRVYRPDATDASHSFMFHQVEGFLVDKDVRFSDLKGVLEQFSQRFFGKDVKIRLRPHFFPFTEPSAEVDVSCIICGAKPKQEKTCSVCKGTGWLEILGCGMIHPNVFKSMGYPEGEYTGFAFGMGVERITMLKYGIDDIRIFFDNDLNFLKQF